MGGGGSINIITIPGAATAALFVGDSRGGSPGLLTPLVPPAASTHRNVSHSAPSSPVTAARLAKVTRLRKAVVIVITKLGTSGITPGTL